MLEVRTRLRSALVDLSLETSGDESYMAAYRDPVALLDGSITIRLWSFTPIQ